MRRKLQNRGHTSGSCFGGRGDVGVARVGRIVGEVLQQQAVADVLGVLVEGGERRRRFVAVAHFRQIAVGDHAGADARLVFSLQVVEAVTGLSSERVAIRPITQGICNFARVSCACLRREAEEGEAGWRGLGLPFGLDRGELDLLHVAELIAALVAEHDHRKTGGEAEAGGDREERRAKGRSRPLSMYQAEMPSTNIEAVT